MSTENFMSPNSHRLKALLSRLMRSRIVHNIGALYAVQIATYVVPLTVIPYLARVLGPYHWGRVAFAQALGIYFSLIVDFGFQLSAARKVARSVDDKQAIERTLAGVMGAKILLAIACIAMFFLLQIAFPVFARDRRLLWIGAIAGIGQGFSILWLYQGLERMKTSSSIDIATKAVYLIGVFLVIRHPTDDWKVVGLQCVCNVTGTLILLRRAYSEFQFRLPDIAGIWDEMRESASMFLFRSAIFLYTTANALILGIVASPVAVGFYAGPEKITRAILGLLNPVSQSIFPRVSRVVVTDPKRAIYLARVSLIGTLSFGLILGIGLYVYAPTVIRILLGRGYEQAIPVLRILSFLLPTISTANVLGIQWMLPLGMDRAYNKAVISAGLLNLGLAAWWASRWQQVGMAWAVVSAETLVTSLICIFLWRSGLQPWKREDILTEALMSHVGGRNPDYALP